MRRRAAAAALLAGALLVTGAGTVAEGPVEDVVGPIEELVFSEATADGAVTATGDTEVVLAADVFFAVDEADLDPAAVSRLDDVVTRLERVAPTRLTVTGHTDSDGSGSYNDDLSLRRAESVRAVLAAGLPGVTVAAQGRGEREPVAENDTDAHKALNRRVEIVVG